MHNVALDLHLQKVYGAILDENSVMIKEGKFRMKRRVLFYFTQMINKGQWFHETILQINRL